MAKKNKRQVVGLKCTETGHINYTMYKPNNMQNQKVEIKKFCPHLRRHTLHVEVKLG